MAAKHILIQPDQFGIAQQVTNMVLFGCVVFIAQNQPTYDHQNRLVVSGYRPLGRSACGDGGDAESPQITPFEPEHIAKRAKDELERRLGGYVRCEK